MEPSLSGLKPKDVEIMKALQKNASLIPILSKAETMTREECRSNKHHVILIWLF